VPLVPGRRQREVAAGDRAAVPGLQPELHVTGAEAAAEDTGHPQHADPEERGGDQRELGHVRTVLGERRHHDPADHRAYDVRVGDDQQAEQATADGGEREQPRFRADRRSEHPQTAAQYVPARPGGQNPYLPVSGCRACRPYRLYPAEPAAWHLHL
jgi:hypothetical protein